MNTEEWLEAHREEIVERWRDRVRPLAYGAPVPEWEDKVTACFQQVQKLVSDDAISLATEDVEEKLFECPELGSHEHHQIAAWVLASGRRVIGDVTKALGGKEAENCALACEGAIDYLEHSLRINVCQECVLAACCMRSSSLEPMPGGLNE